MFRALWSVRCVLWRDSHFEHAVVWAAVGVFEHTRLEGGVEQILIDTVVGLGLGIAGG